MTTKPSNKMPTHDVCHVLEADEKKGRKARWTRIGAGWLHEDGMGLSLKLNFMPIGSDGRLVVRVRKEKDEQDEGAEQ